MLKQKVRLVNKSNVGCVAIVCNTAHVLLPELQKVSKIPFVSMIDETVKQVRKDGISKIGLLGTPSTIKHGLYQKACAINGISVIVPSEGQISVLGMIIRNVISGKILENNADSLEKIADDLGTIGTEGIILGCSELPLVFPKKYSLPVYNSVEILAIALLKQYYN